MKADFIPKLIFFALLLASCTDRKKNEEELIKREISNFVSDEFFKRNFDFKMIEIKINKVEKYKMDTLILMRLRDYLYYKSNELIEKNRSNFSDPIALADWSSEVASQQPKFVKLKKIRNDYASDEIGMNVTAYIKGTYSNKSSQTTNYLLKDRLFLLDHKLKIIDSYLGFGDE